MASPSRGFKEHGACLCTAIVLPFITAKELLAGVDPPHSAPTVTIINVLGAIEEGKGHTPSYSTLETSPQLSSIWLNYPLLSYCAH
jgi:hypothetical protein